MDRKIRFKKHEEHIDDIALDISQSSIWRKELFKSSYDEKLLIDKSKIKVLPNYFKKIFLEYDLKYFVSKVAESSEDFDDGLIVFKFEAADFPSLMRFSGNNPDII